MIRSALILCALLTGCASFQPDSTLNKIPDPVIRQAAEGCRALALSEGKDDSHCLKLTVQQIIRQYKIMYQKGFKAGKAGGRCEQWVGR